MPYIDTTFLKRNTEIKRWHSSCRGPHDAPSTWSNSFSQEMYSIEICPNKLAQWHEACEMSTTEVNSRTMFKGNIKNQLSYFKNLRKILGFLIPY